MIYTAESHQFDNIESGVSGLTCDKALWALPFGGVKHSGFGR